MIRVNKELCDGCGTCISVCAQDAIELTETHPVIHIEQCNYCTCCITVCPFKAMELEIKK